METKLQVLKRCFGYAAFRDGQEPLIDSILEGHDTVGIMPTGAGKSLCFQIPALLLQGITLVVSPLISLMKDQVNALLQNGVRAAYLNSSLNPAQQRAALANARQGIYKIIYVAPERLLTPDFLDFAIHAPITLFTVDEAHCASHWGHDFRPSYVDIPHFLELLPQRPPVAAFTATATAQVREDFIQMLHLQAPFVQVSGFDRANLSFSVRHPKDKQAELLQLVASKRDQCGIIYCLTRREVEEVCQVLQEQGYPAMRYHAGLADDERKDSQDAFLYDRCRILVATNAFGMGIDKSDVSYVIHYNMPKDLESYYQEAGRAGRDGSPADCILLYSGKDVITNQFLIDNNTVAEGEDEAQAEQNRKLNRERLKQMAFYCHTTNCLRAYILHYFGEEAPTHCGNCGNCLSHFVETDITMEARHILNAVLQLRGRFGMTMVVELLRGSRNKRMLERKLDQLPAHGQLKNLREPRVWMLVRAMVQEGYLTLTKEEYPVLQLGERAREVLDDGEPVRLKLPEESEPTPAEKSKTPRQERLDGVQAESNRDPLFERLRQLRFQLASEQKRPAYLVFNDASLRDMCNRLPQTPMEFLQVSGVGESKLERYGDAFLRAIRTYLEQNPDH